MQETDLTELNKLEALLKESGIPYERKDENVIPREEVIKCDYRHFFDRHQIAYPNFEHKVSDVVIFFGTYGYEDGFLEQMGLLPPDAGDSVQGYLTAETVFERWKAHWEKQKEAKDAD